MPGTTSRARSPGRPTRSTPSTARWRLAWRPSLAAPTTRPSSSSPRSATTTSGRTTSCTRARTASPSASATSGPTTSRRSRRTSSSEVPPSLHPSLSLSPLVRAPRRNGRANRLTLSLAFNLSNSSPPPPSASPSPPPHPFFGGAAVRRRLLYLGGPPRPARRHLAQHPLLVRLEQGGRRLPVRRQRGRQPGDGLARGPARHLPGEKHAGSVPPARRRLPFLPSSLPPPPRPPIYLAPPPHPPPASSPRVIGSRPSLGLTSISLPAPPPYPVLPLRSGSRATSPPRRATTSPTAGSASASSPSASRTRSSARSLAT